MDLLNLIIKKLHLLSEPELLFVSDIIDESLSAGPERKNSLMEFSDDLKKMMATSFLTKRITGPFSKALLVETNDELYAVDPEDHVVGWELRHHGAFAPEQLSFVKELLTTESNLLIVGAHIGTLVIPLARACSKIVAIEANPQSFQLLELNIHINQVNNCRAFNIAASDKPGDIPFLMSRVNSGGSKRKPIVKDYMYYYDNPTEIMVPGFPLDTYLSDETFDVIVMDIEGSEYFALKGMQRLISSARYLIVEFLPHHFRNVAGISVADFLSVLPVYESLTVPSLKKTVGREDFLSLLTYMYDHNITDDGIVFESHI